MSTSDIPAPAVSPPRADRRATLRHPEVRNYLAAALAGLVFVFGILFGRGSDLGAVLTVIMGLAGVFLRWTAAPPFVVLLTSYFLLFPTGLPFYGTSESTDLPRKSFRVEDLILAAALVIYVGSQYRLFGLLGQAVPAEDRRPSNADPLRRPVGAVPAAEVVDLLWAAAAVVMIGQLAWAVIVAVRVDAGRDFPFVMAEARSYRSADVPGLLSPPRSRFVVLVAMCFGVAGASGVVFWYWRMRTLKQDEARMILQDTEWGENRRELDRVEGWRAGIKRRLSRKSGRGRP